MKHFTILVFLMAALISSAFATSITADLSCVITGSDTLGACPGPISYGTITLDDLDNSGTIQVSVDLTTIGGTKFRDLMLNFEGTGITSISSSDGQPVTLAYDSYSIKPYAIGLFDVGSTSNQGWVGTDPYTTVLSGNSALTLDMFKVLDHSGALNVAVHLQNMPPDGGSLKVGGLWDLETSNVPEPATGFLLGSVLLGLLFYRFKS